MRKALSILLAIVLTIAAPALAHASNKLCLLGLAGASNANGFNSWRPAPAPPNTVWRWTGSGWSFADNLGGMAPNVASELHNRTGVRVMLVVTAINGGWQTDRAKAVGGASTVDTWDVGGGSVQQAFNIINAAKSWAQSVGLDPRYCGTIWVQGESDGNAIAWCDNGTLPNCATTMTKAVYKTALQTMIGRWLAEFGGGFYIARSGMARDGSTDAGMGPVRDAQDETGEEMAAQGVRVVTRLALQCGQRAGYVPDRTAPYTLAELGMMVDNTHLGPDCLDAMGLDAAARVHESGLWNRW